MKPRNESDGIGWPDDAPAGVDLSNYDWADAGSSSATFAVHMRQLGELGYEVAIVGCQFPAIAAAQIDVLRELGMRVPAVYAQVFDRAGSHKDAIAVALEHRIGTVMLTCEGGGYGSGMSPFTRGVTISNAVRDVRLAGLQVGINTAPGWWNNPATVTVPGNLTDALVWLSDYRTDRDIVRTTNLRGLKADVDVHQFATVPPPWASAEDRRYNRDRNCFLTRFWESDAMTPAEKQAMDALAERVRRIEWATFSGAEDRDKTDAQRAADVAYRIGQIVDEGTTGSVADRAQSALVLFRELAARGQAAGTLPLDDAFVREVIARLNALLGTAAPAPDGGQ